MTACIQSIYLPIQIAGENMQIPLCTSPSQYHLNYIPMKENQKHILVKEIERTVHQIGKSIQMYMFISKISSSCFSS